MESNGYKHLERRSRSNYQQLFVKGRRIRAEVLYRQTIGEDPRTPAKVAEDYDLPIEVVEEAIDYCLKNPEVLAEDRAREWANIQADEARRPSPKPVGWRHAMGGFRRG